MTDATAPKAVPSISRLREVVRYVLPVIAFVLALGGAVATADTMPVDFTNCADCHSITYQTHPLTNCTACHTYYFGSDIDHQGADFTTRPAGSCVASCHITTWPNVTTYVHGTSASLDAGYVYFPLSPLGRQSGITSRFYDCTDCHNPAYPSIYSHDASAIDSQHDAGITGTVCASCHENSLLAEHVKYPTESAVKFNCATCHESTKSFVIAAIASGTTECGACHPNQHEATWSYPDYYSWTTGAGDGSGTPLSELGANPANPGVHANYLANTAKCGICHSVHRANASGVKLLNTATATCAGCHTAGVSTVTDVLVSWQTGGPHSSGTDASCNSRGCHLNNPHGAGASQYKIFAAKLIGNMPNLADSGAKADLSVAAAVSNPTSSGVTANLLNGFEEDGTTPLDNGTRQAVVVGYTCNSWGCHEQTMLPVINKGYAEDRLTKYPESFGTEVLKTGHITASAEATSAHASYNPIYGCTSCHDQTDDATRSGFTFPHSQTAVGASNLGAGRAWLWMGIASNAAGSDLTAMSDPNMKSFDGACLKCHRSSDGAAGVGASH